VSLNNRAAQIAERLVGAWAGITEPDRVAIRSATEGVVDNILENLKFRVRVDFNYEWSGRHWRGDDNNPPEHPEFEISNERIGVFPAVHSVAIGTIRDWVTRQLSKGSLGQRSDTEEFLEILKEVVESKNGEWGEADVEILTRRRGTTVNVQQKLRLVGTRLMIALSVKDEDFGKVMETIWENAGEWFPDTRNDREFDQD
jgi:hypothetical protein